MEEIMQRIKAQMIEKQKLVRMLKHMLRDSPRGRIQVTMAGNTPKFYWITDGERRYLRKTETDYIKSLMEKSYYVKLLKETEEELRVLQNFIDHFDPKGQANVYDKMHEQRKRFVDPLVLPDKEYTEKWLEDSAKEAEEWKNSYPIVNGFLTLNGETVRSKSEKILADAFSHYNIIYLYEAPLKLKNKTIYPDFKLLDLKRRRTVYWEHFGMMDRPEYAEAAVRKIMEYEAEGLLLGNQLIITMETTEKPLNIEDVERILKQFFQE